MDLCRTTLIFTALFHPDPAPEGRLAEIDAASVRPLRAIAQGETVQADHDKLTELDAEAAGLRVELAGLQGS
jgi:hypothetical protein